MGMGFNHWFGRGARLVLGGPYKHNRRTAAPRVRRPFPSGPGQPSHAPRELNQPPGGLASSGPGLRGPWEHPRVTKQEPILSLLFWQSSRRREELAER